MFAYVCVRLCGRVFSQMSATLSDHRILRAIFGRGRRERRGLGEENEEGLLRTVDSVFNI